MLGKDTLTGERFIKEGADKEGVPVRGVGAKEVPAGGDSPPLLRRCGLLESSPFEVGLSKFWRPEGREDRWSGELDETGTGRDRAEPF